MIFNKKIGNKTFIQRVKNWFESPSNILICIGIILGISLHIMTFGSIYKAPPSEGFSREIKIGEVSYGESQFNKEQMAVASSENHKIGVFTIDGLQTKMFMVDDEGSVTNSFSIPLDLSKSQTTSGFFKEDSEFVVLYHMDHLYALTINVETGEYTNTKVIDSIKAFKNEGYSVTFTREEGLYGINLDSEVKTEVLIEEGDILSFSTYEKANKLYVFSLINNEMVYADGAIKIFDKNYNIIKEQIIFERTGSKFIRKIDSLYYDDNLLTCLFSLKNSRANTNTMTILRINVNTGEEISRISRDSEVYFGKVVIEESSRDQVAIITQKDIINGVNIVRNIIVEGEKDMIIPLTKTRGSSSAPFYLQIKGDKVLIFSDFDSDQRQIYFASSNENIVKRTTTYRNISFLNVIVTSIALFFVALFMTIPLVGIMEIIPAMMILVGLKVLSKLKHKFFILLASSALAHIIIKVIIVKDKVILNGSIIPNINLGGNYMNVVLIISAIYALICSYLNAKRHDDVNVVRVYTLFAILDLVFLALYVMSYSIGNMLLYKTYI